MSKPLLSIIIATRNRAAVLDKCLSAIAADHSCHEPFDVLVADNGSRDATASVVTRHRRSGLPVHRLYEDRPGSSRARNAGVAHAEGACLVFLDDDALVAPGFRAAYGEVFRAPMPDLVQGRIIPRFASRPPHWLGREFWPRFGEVDEGPQPAAYAGTIRSGNLGITRKAFEDLGGFRLDLGPGTSGLGDDTELGLRARKAGYAIAYAPAALVYHLIPRERLSRSAFLRRCYISGRSQAQFQSYNEGLLRMTAHFAKLSCARLLRALLAPDAAVHVRTLAAAAEHMGRVAQIWRQRVHG